MLYPCSPSLQSLPVPGIGFCQRILVDQYAFDRAHRRVWGWCPAATDRASQEAADVAAAGQRLH